MTAIDSQSEQTVQLFNESVLGSNPTDSIPILLPKLISAWVPKQVILDYKDSVCFGAMLHYERSHPFETLRRAINSRFSSYEHPSFADDPEMGIWRVEDAGFAIQLSDSDEEDSYLVIYTLFVDPATLATKLEELSRSKPELLAEVLLSDSTDALRECNAANASKQDSE